jgi:alpha-amylase
MLRSLSHATSIAALVLATTAAAQVPAPQTPGPQVPPPALAQPPEAPDATTVDPKQEWARGAVFYEVNVRNFADSNGDGTGDFKGLMSKLNYLNDGNPKTTTDLGVDAIALGPIFEAASADGYETTDYDKVEKDYGTNADFKRLTDEVHKRGMRVVVDLVMNHTGDQHPWFAASASSAKSPKRDWYVWRTENPGWKQPGGGESAAWHARGGAFYYGASGSTKPDLNYRNLAVKADLFRIVRHWLGQGVDGFRIADIRYLVEAGAGSEQADTPETFELLKELAAEVRRLKPEAILVGASAAETGMLAAYFDALPMNLNFPLASAIVEGMKSGISTAIPKVMLEMFDLYPRGTIDVPFLTNRDQTRIASAVGGNAGKLRTAAAILLTMSGAPFLHAGEEIGLQTGNFNAETVAAQLKDPESLLSYYRGWIAARKRSPALSKGWFQATEVSVRVAVYTRFTPEEAVIVVHNIRDVDFTVPMPIGAVKLTPVHVDKGVGVPNTATGTWTVKMPPNSTGVWRAE